MGGAGPLHLAIKNQRIEVGDLRATGPGHQQGDSVAAPLIPQGQIPAGVAEHDSDSCRQSRAQGKRPIAATASNAGPPVLAPLPW
jgi:hypothetical protein